jgi:hypothetical protein
MESGSVLEGEGKSRGRQNHEERRKEERLEVEEMPHRYRTTRGVTLPVVGSILFAWYYRKELEWVLHEAPRVLEEERSETIGRIEEGKKKRRKEKLLKRRRRK